jgi:hypothetical protein
MRGAATGPIALGPLSWPRLRGRERRRAYSLGGPCAEAAGRGGAPARAHTGRGGNRGARQGRVRDVSTAGRDLLVVLGQARGRGRARTSPRRLPLACARRRGRAGRSNLELRREVRPPLVQLSGPGGVAACRSRGTRCKSPSSAMTFSIAEMSVGSHSEGFSTPDSLTIRRSSSRM